MMSQESLSIPFSESQNRNQVVYSFSERKMAYAMLAVYHLSDDDEMVM